MARLNTELRRIIKTLETAKELECEELGTKYKALSADDPRSQDLNPVFLVTMN